LFFIGPSPVLTGAIPLILTFSPKGEKESASGNSLTFLLVERGRLPAGDTAG
jgi:hypothetical protein